MPAAALSIFMLMLGACTSTGQGAQGWSGGSKSRLISGSGSPPASPERRCSLNRKPCALQCSALNPTSGPTQLLFMVQHEVLSTGHGMLSWCAA